MLSSSSLTLVVFFVVNFLASDSLRSSYGKFSSSIKKSAPSSSSSSSLEATYAPDTDTVAKDFSE